MKGVYIINYSVKGIKSLDKWIKLSFYKKTIDKNFEIKNYNIKGIYGTNGAGKSAIVISVGILKNLILDDSYLNNPLVQEQLKALVNKKTNTLEYCVDFLISEKNYYRLYSYTICLAKNKKENFIIENESLSSRKAASHTDHYTKIYEINNGEFGFLQNEGKEAELIVETTRNLLNRSTLPALIMNRTLIQNEPKIYIQPMIMDTLIVYFFGTKLFIYLDNEDDHSDYALNNLIRQPGDVKRILSIMQDLQHLKTAEPSLLSPKQIVVPKEEYANLEHQVQQLLDFLRVFKHDIKDIVINKKEDRETYICNLLIDYEDYRVDAELESTGIKKLIRLFIYLNKMAEGSIVFVDELDSNLHDVYLCALLEYLKDYGKGQLCFTTHNIGPMDVLKQNKKSIEFLSVDKTIYSWTASGNYSPSKLYRNGMIEGSPFNVDAVDFIGVFNSDRDE